LQLPLHCQFTQVQFQHGEPILSPQIANGQDRPTEEDYRRSFEFHRYADFMPPGEEEDTTLIGLVDKIGNRWRRISEILGQQFPPRTRIEIKNRAKWLLDTRRNTRLMSRRQDESPDPIIEEVPVEATRGENFDPVRFFTVSAFPTADSQIE
jgi:hypothetical protein